MAITSQEIPHDTWRRYFEALTDVLRAVEGTGEVIGRDVGDQIADERQVLTDITYDDRDDALIVDVEAPDSDGERVEHVIEHPQRAGSHR
jgi:hypothetical protein